ncbi:PAP2-domain-containing protein, partial [Aureobasidium melanogenum]
MASVDSLTASFYDNEQYSDITIKFGEHQIRAHKVAWNTVIDVGDEDDPQLLTDVIKYLYRRGTIYDSVKRPVRTIALQKLIYIYLLADKYDIQGLRRETASAFNEMALIDLRNLRHNHTFKSSFVEHIARICGPSCLQLADDTLQALVMHLCQAYSSSLFRNEVFLQQYMKGEMFDSKHSAEFGAKLGKDLLKTQKLNHEEVSRHSRDWNPSLIGIEARQRNTKNFFNDKRFSDVSISYGDSQSIMAHKIVLATHSHEFQTMLAGSLKSAEIDLRNEHSSAAVATFIEDMYIPEFPVPDTKHDPSLLAELYLLARKHGLETKTRTYLRRFNIAMYSEPFTDEYLAYIADFCGPGSYRYADTGLAEEAFDNILDRILTLKDEGTEDLPYKTLTQRFKEGSLFNTMFMGRFATKMTSRHLDLASVNISHFKTTHYRRYPYAVHERVPAGICYIIVVICPAIIICFWTLVVDGLFAHSQPTDAEGTGRRLGRYRLVDRLWELNCGILGLALSEGTAFVITGTLKNTVGKPRPDLIDRCQPRAGSVDPSPYGLSNSTICTQTDMSILRDGFRSFPSGHSSSSFAGLFYLSLYLAAKLHIWDSRGEVWKIFVVIIPSLGAALIAASRIMDARHHPFDVIVGSLLGIGCAWLSYRQYFPPVTETWRKGRAYPIRTWGQETAPPPAAISTAYEPYGRQGTDPQALPSQRRHMQLSRDVGSDSQAMLASHAAPFPSGGLAGSGSDRRRDEWDASSTEEDEFELQQQPRYPPGAVMGGSTAYLPRTHMGTTADQV